MRYAYFVRRPILASAIALIISLCGLVALFHIPVSQFPEISPPSITVSASFPGANAETSARVVAAQIENQLNGVSNLLYMATNTSSSGRISIRLTYEVGTDLNIAINDVLNRLYASKQLLPAVVQKMGINARKSSPDTLLQIAFYSEPYINPTWVSNYLQRTVLNDLYLIPSVGNVTVRGAGKYALTAWLDPNKMQRYNMDIAEVQNALNDQNQEYIIGRTNSAPNTNPKFNTFNLIGQQMYGSVHDLSNTVIRNNGNQTIRVQDIARVQLSSNDYSTIAFTNFNDEQGNFKRYPITTLEVQLSPGANQLSAKKQIMAELEKDSLHFPTGLHYRITQDNSRFVAASLKNVSDTIIIAFVLVSLILLLFLQNWRASVLALCTIPVSLLGTIACLYILGFSLNTLSLFAFILAVGIVVDDAIVIIENVERLRSVRPELSLTQVIEETMHEMSGAVIAIVLVLSVVFIPVMGLGGLSGIMYQQFAVTIACAVVISGFSALTFIPALCNLMLTGKHTPLKIFDGFNRGFAKLDRFYLRAAERLILMKKTVFFVWLSIILLTVGIYKTVSMGFVPNEDQALVFATVNMPTTYALADTESVVKTMLRHLNKNKNIDSVVSLTGVDMLDSGGQKPSAASLVVSLKDWSMRSGAVASADEMIQAIEKMGRKFPGMVTQAYNQPPIRGLSTTGGVEFYIEDRVVGDPAKLEAVVNQLIERLKHHPEVRKAYQTLNTHTLQIAIEPDIDRSKHYGVSLRDYYNALQTMYSNNNVNFAYLMQGLIWVVLEADFRFRASIQNLSNVFVHSSNSGQMVPLATLSKISYGTAPQVMQRYNGYTASKVVVNPRPGYSMGDVMGVIMSEATKLPKGYAYDWFGTSFQQQQSQQTSIKAFGFALIMIYLVLAALYEMWRLPLVIILGVPVALFGAGIILLVSGQQNDLYFQISLIALLGLSAKNIILLVEFAVQQMQQGHTPRNSILHALKIRFRPIVMTSCTFIGGTIPLILASGAGANAQHSVGMGIIGGMLGSLLIATLLTPALFVIVMGKKEAKK